MHETRNNCTLITRSLCFAPFGCKSTDFGIMWYVKIGEYQIRTRMHRSRSATAIYDCVVTTCLMFTITNRPDCNPMCWHFIRWYFCLLSLQIIIMFCFYRSHFIHMQEYLWTIVNGTIYVLCVCSVYPRFTCKRWHTLLFVVVVVVVVGPWRRRRKFIKAPKIYFVWIHTHWWMWKCGDDTVMRSKLPFYWN